MTQHKGKEGRVMPSETERMGLRGPGSELAPQDAEAIAAIRHKLSQLRGETGDPCGGAKPIAPLAVKVNNLIEQRDGLCRLCGEIIATFTLPANQDQVAAMGAGFPAILASWQRQFAKCSGEA